MIKQESRAYFTALGAHVSTLRKSRGMTQAELARAIGVSPQAVFAYELGDRRISVLVLAKLARIFSTPVGDLVGLSKPVRERKGRLSPRCVRHAERLQALSKTQQRFVIRIIDVLEDGNGRPGCARTSGRSRWIKAGNASCRDCPDVRIEDEVESDEQKYGASSGSPADRLSLGPLAWNPSGAEP